MEDGENQAMLFQVCDVNKVLASVSRLCAGGCRVVFETGNNYIENMNTGRITPLQERNGVYVLEAWASRKAPFHRQG
jgi:hypothetical protein